MTVVDAAAIGTLGINAVALVWGAAKLTAEVEHLRLTVLKVEKLLEHWMQTVTAHGERIARLEASQE